MTEQVNFEGARGQRLAGRLDLPVGKPRGMALFAHCFSCSKDIAAAREIARHLASQGFGVLRFDFTGLGASGGDFSDTNFSTNLEDLEAAAAWLAEEYSGPSLLIGHSLGGAAVVAVAARLPWVKAVATIGAPSDAEHVIHNFATEVETIKQDGEAEVLLAGRPFTIKKQFIDDVSGARVKDAAANLKHPLLVLHAPGDEVVGIDNATGLFVSAKHPKSFVSLDTADHLLTRPSDARYAADVIAAWAGKYLPATLAAEDGTVSGAVTVEETGISLYQNSVCVGSHRLLADEPPAIGGNDTGPDPYDYVTAGLGACTSITLRMYANRKKWPLDRIRV
ncbi:MAG: alpha/beta fold hydrolase, partial [Pseudomonadota bacterium]